jgi:hypothetical protein
MSSILSKSPPVLVDIVVLSIALSTASRSDSPTPMITARLMLPLSSAGARRSSRLHPLHIITKTKTRRYCFSQTDNATGPRSAMRLRPGVEFGA